MSQSNIELNNKMSQIIPKIEYCFGMILLYTVIIFTMLSTLFGGVIMFPIYGLIFLINKIRKMYTKLEKKNLKEEPPKTKIIVKKPLIDETWCNLSVKNIIDYDESEDVEEDETDICDNCDNIKEDEDDLLCHSCYHKSCEENGDECWCTNEAKEEAKVKNEIEAEPELEENKIAVKVEAEAEAEEILSIIPPNELDTIEEEDAIDSLNN